MSVLERVIEKHVNEILIPLRVLCLKSRPIENGYPDRQYILPNGLSVWIEFKRKGEKPDRLQEYRMEQLSKRLQIVGWTDDFGTAVRVVEALLGTPYLSRRGDKDAPWSGRWRVIFGPRSGKNLNLASYLQDLEAARICPECAYRGSPASDLQSMARRDREMAGVRGAELHDPPWPEQTPEPET